MAGAEVNRPAVTDTPPAISVTTADGCVLELRHDRGPAAHEGRPAVLLVHGASAGSDTFRIGEEQTLVDYLLGQGLDVWTLDWRASMRRVKDVYCKAVYEGRLAGTFTIDAAAEHDVPAAIAAMRQKNVRGKIAVLGHCMGGAIITQGIARGAISSADMKTVVLTGLGLFYRAAIDNVLKAEDQVLEGLLVGGQHLLHPTKRWERYVCTRDPGDGPWPPPLEDPYGVWLDTPLPDDCTVEICHRLSYMFGMPFIRTCTRAGGRSRPCSRAGAACQARRRTDPRAAAATDHRRDPACTRIVPSPWSGAGAAGRRRAGPRGPGPRP